MCIRWNCSSDANFGAQSQLIRKRFLEKGYNPQHLDRVNYEVSNTTQNSCLIEGVKPKDDRHESREILINIGRFWEIRKIDPILRKALPPFIYCTEKNPSLVIVWSKKCWIHLSDLRCFVTRWASMRAESVRLASKSIPISGV